MIQKKQNWLPFKEARTYSKNLKFKSRSEWFEWAKSEQKPPYLPINPQTVYRHSGWISWGDWLGTGFIHCSKRQFRNFEDAQKLAQSLEIKTYREWRAWAKTESRPKDIPSHPYKTYKYKGWVNWGHFLGTDNIPTNLREFWSFHKARRFVRKQGLKSVKSWEEWSAAGLKPKEIPAAPHRIYKNKGWIDWPNWLGKKK